MIVNQQSKWVLIFIQTFFWINKNTSGLIIGGQLLTYRDKTCNIPCRPCIPCIFRRKLFTTDWEAYNDKKTHEVRVLPTFHNTAGMTV